MIERDHLCRGAGMRRPRKQASAGLLRLSLLSLRGKRQHSLANSLYCDDWSSVSGSVSMSRPWETGQLLSQLIARRHGREGRARNPADTNQHNSCPTRCTRTTIYLRRVFQHIPPLLFVLNMRWVSLTNSRHGGFVLLSFLLQP